jgi:hypothetical protein
MEGEVDIPPITHGRSITTVVQDVMEQIKVGITYGCQPPVPNLTMSLAAIGTDPHNNRSLILSVGRSLGNIHNTGLGKSLLKEGLVECLTTMWLTRVHIITASNLGVHTILVGISGGQSLLLLGILHGMVAIVIVG